jgi:uncharacterized RDD family membrane protein YckC
MQYCDYCGQEIPQNVSFCRHCGKELTNAQLTPIHSEIKEEEIKTNKEIITHPPLTRPWARFWARHFDLYLFCMIFLIIRYNYNFSIADSIIANIVFLIIVNILLESLCLYLFKTTPGKWIAHIKIVSSTDERSLSYSQAISRTLQVWARGMWLYILPIISLLPMWTAKKSLEKNGTTSWDTFSITKVLQGPISWIRYTVLFLSFFIVFFIQGIIMTYLKHLP